MSKAKPTPSLRHIHLWNRSSDRRTCALVHADSSLLSLEEATRAMLSRWGASENTFKHLQERHPAHYQPGFKLVESERQDIANPEYQDPGQTHRAPAQGAR
jgi:hypothetical protein